MMTITTIQQAIRTAQAQIKGLEGVPEKYRPANHVARVANLSGQIDALRKVLEHNPGYVPDDQAFDLDPCQSCEDITSDVREVIDPRTELDDEPERVTWCGRCYRVISEMCAD